MLSRRGEVLAVFVLALMLVMASSVLAQTNPLQKKSTSVSAVCPLSDSQTENAIAAFAKMVPTFTKEPRCVNCHGGVDPFSESGKHGGGQMDPDPDFKTCDTCHSDMPAKTGGSPSKWRLSLPEHRFLGKDAKTLCKQMRSVFVQGADFIGHLIDDNGNSKFTETAFLGNRGLNDVGKALVDNYKDEPPKNITHGGLVQLGLDWINAMGGEFEGDIGCGCEPQHFAVRVFYQSKISLPIQQFNTVAAPVDIPITFHDDHSYVGQGAMPQVGAGRNPACVSESQDSVMIKAFGDAIEEWQRNEMHVALTNASPEVNKSASTCQTPWGLRTFFGSNVSAEKELFVFEMPGRVGDTRVQQVPLPTPVASATIGVQIIRLDSEGSNPQ